MVPNVDGDDGGLVVLVDYDRESVRQDEFLVRDVNGLGLEIGKGWAKEKQDDQDR
jgi:hypothetical protein